MQKNHEMITCIRSKQCQCPNVINALKQTPCFNEKKTTHFTQTLQNNGKINFLHTLLRQSLNLKNVNHQQQSKKQNSSKIKPSQQHAIP